MYARAREILGKILDLFSTKLQGSFTTWRFRFVKSVLKSLNLYWRGAHSAALLDAFVAYARVSLELITKFEIIYLSQLILFKLSLGYHSWKFFKILVNKPEIFWIPIFSFHDSYFSLFNFLYIIISTHVIINYSMLL